MSRGRRAKARARPSAAGLSVNRASLEALIAVPGIGAALAQQIVAGRPWATLDALTRIRGISAARIARWQSEAGLVL